MQIEISDSDLDFVRNRLKTLILAYIEHPASLTVKSALDSTLKLTRIILPEKEMEDIIVNTIHGAFNFEDKKEGKTKD